jgi:UDP-glucose 4-epimerase
MDMRPDIICHQAAQLSVSRSVRDPLFDAQINCIGLLNVLTAAADAKCPRIVFASSGGVLYGNMFVPAHETTVLKPVSPYGITKWTGERYLEFFAKQYGMTAVALRYSNVYGPRQNPHGEAGVVAIFAAQFLNDKPITINGDGKYVRDYVYGLDVARANVMAMTANLSDSCLTSFNIGTGIGTDVNQIAHLIGNAVKQHSENAEFIPKIEYGPTRPGDLRSNIISPDFAERALHWTPKIGLERGIAATVEWFARV